MKEIIRFKFWTFILNQPRPNKIVVLEKLREIPNPNQTVKRLIRLLNQAIKEDLELSKDNEEKYLLWDQSMAHEAEDEEEAKIIGWKRLFQKIQKH